MNEHTITSKMQNDGTLVESLPDDSEKPLKEFVSSPMSDEQVKAAALTDLDNLPFTENELKNVKPFPRVKTIRRALMMTQEEFAQKFQLSLSTLRDWEQGRYQPDQAARTYLKVIARSPQVVMDALSSTPSEVRI